MWPASSHTGVTRSSTAEPNKRIHRSHSPRRNRYMRLKRSRSAIEKIFLRSTEIATDACRYYFDDVCCACWRWRGDWTVCVARRSQFPEVHPLATSLSSPNYSPARTSTAPIPAHTTLPRCTMTSHQSPSTHAPFPPRSPSSDPPHLVARDAHVHTRPGEHEPDDHQHDPRPTHPRPIQFLSVVCRSLALFTPRRFFSRLVSASSSSRLD